MSTTGERLPSMLSSNRRLKIGPGAVPSCAAYGVNVELVKAKDPPNTESKNMPQSRAGAHHTPEKPDGCTTTPPLMTVFLRELISAEEGKLAVSRSLLSLKLEHSKLLEKFESDRYGLTTDLLAAKNEVVELEMG